MKSRVLIVAAGLAVGGCASLPPSGPVGRSSPIIDASGTVIGYEEAAGNGAVIRDLRGRTIGWRVSDNRSRMTNPNGRGYTLIVRSLPFEPAKVSAVSTGE